MDAKTKYTRLVQDVKNELAKDKAKFDRIKERNRHQEKYKELWKKASIDEVVEKFAPNAEPIINDSGKIIFRTPGSNIQVVCEATIGSLRIQDLSISNKKKSYLDLDGSRPINITENGKTRGLTDKEYELATHFRIKKPSEL